MKPTILLSIVGVVAIPLACAAEIPLRTQHYNNPDYDFSVDLPGQLLGCISENTDHGVDILLDGRPGCGSLTDQRPYATVFANYNVATNAKTPKALARLHCRGPEVKRVVRLTGWSLGGRAAAGCRLYRKGGGIEVKLMTLRKTDPQNPEAWIEVGAYLSTTAARYERDLQEFRKIVETVRIAPDGPQH